MQFHLSLHVKKLEKSKTRKTIAIASQKLEKSRIGSFPGKKKPAARTKGAQKLRKIKNRQISDKKKLLRHAHCLLYTSDSADTAQWIH